MKDLSLSDISRIIEMAWKDCTPFEGIELQIGLKENDVRRIMRHELTAACMKSWGVRTSSLSTDTNANAGQKYSNNHLNPNVLYTLLHAVLFVICF